MSGRIRVSAPERRTSEGIVFDSRAEMKRFDELRMLERVGVIAGLERQPRFVLQEAFRHRAFGLQRAIEYRADFAYTERDTGRRIVEDCKGMLTEIYKLKRKLFLAKYPEIEFKEVSA